MTPRNPAGRAALRAVAALVVGGLGWYELGRRAWDAGRLLPTTTPTTVDDIVGAAALLSVWALLAWIALVVTLSALGAAPGVIGRMFARAADAITPGVLRRLAAVTLGVSIAGSGSSALASTVSSPPTAAHAVDTSTTRRAEVLTTARAMRASATPPAEGPAVAPAAGMPTTPRAVARTTASAAGRSAIPPSVLDAPPLDRPADPRVVTVQPGDCLWDIAARTLGGATSAAAIAAEWPRWYAANRAVIGPDPDLVLPGQRLVEPD